MSRVTQSEVQAIKEVDANLVLTPFIDAANTIVNSLNADCGKSFDEARLKQIELYLSAHFVGAMKPNKATERFENWEVNNHVGNRIALGIMSDKHGQMANMLADGCLAEKDKMPAIIQVVI